ncbi:MAG: activase [Deltaproteobacteria bacterium]|jgi:predicted CoA-substrate-specific enzyme activase|nr:activase [Deltaproteobacteria bacterium]
MDYEGSKRQSHQKKSSNDTLTSLGLCLGASTVSIVQLEQKQNPKSINPAKRNNNPRIVKSFFYPHEGDPKRTLLRLINGLDLNEFDRIVATGRRFRSFVNLTSIPEPEAVEHAYRYIKPMDVLCPAIVSAGGETFMVYVLNRFGQISNVLTGNKCASGTGEFFLQQLRRMDVTLEEAAQWAAATEAYPVSGRCSVFCKSDCTHATNKGIPKSKVTAGLGQMMANKILELLKNVERKNIIITGGTARNQMMIERLRKEIPGLIVPDEAPYFEALGAALWGLENETSTLPSISDLLSTEVSSFDTLPPLNDFIPMVEFKTIEKGEIHSGDTCILGLDVGSTTTKAILLRKSDDALLASVYLRTSGDPVGASRQCYRIILDQVKQKVHPSEISIEGLGVCGSGRQIAGLHALTNGIINEIIAHAAAAVYFDPQVDTIFEIGGQDAKYTYITNSVASDYAMNEACSAGTGSFLEESAQETLGVKMEDIANIALKGKNPPNFNDQCAAFITSDIKNAIHEGVEHENIVAGLVYSICMNYSHRVKGNRPVGEKVFMQGGVCYNRAIPLAMASLVGKPIIVPPEPGLMGAYGVALEVKQRLENGMLQKQHFDLEVLLNRQVKYGKSFICKGGKEKCDRRCNIAMIELEGHTYPFGGACNRYYNLRHNIRYHVKKLDMVRVRQQLVFEKYGAQSVFDTAQDSFAKKRKKTPKKIGINKSFLVNTYYPLYSTFFAKLGFEIVVPDFYTQKGIDQKNASFCYPAELTHGFFHTLIEMKHPPEFIFLPHFKALPISDGNSSAQVCPFVQGETYYLQAAFRQKLKELKTKGTTILTPLLDLTKGLDSARTPLIETAVQMGCRPKAAISAFNASMKRQTACMAEMSHIGKKVLQQLEADPNQIAVVIFARPYNGFVEEAHMGIPHKLASRGILVIPFDFLLFNREKSKRHMYWGMGQRILQVARVVKKHPQLFGTFITNFSCGPDSFIIGYFRDIMGRKPSLTLELDSHTADAGLETRIEAFIDIISAYRELTATQRVASKKRTFTLARTKLEKGIPKVITSSGKTLPMIHPRVKLLIPSMGKLTTESLAAVFRGLGYNAIAHPPSNETILKLGRANTSCKECLPLILTTGTLLNFIYNERKEGDILVYFMLTGSGPCRFGQYRIFMEDLVKKQEIPDVALFSLTSENSYAGLGNDFHLKAWCGVIVSDTMEDIRSMLLANAVDVESAIGIFNTQWDLIIDKFEKGDYSQLEKQLIQTAKHIRKIPLKHPPEAVPTISVVGEIFVRRDELSRQYLTERLAEKGFATICSPIAEWALYSDYLVDKGLVDYDMSFREKLSFLLKKIYMARYSRRIKSILEGTGLVQAEPLNIKSIINNASPHVSLNLAGEAILTVGSALTDIASHTCGVIAIGPFGCMPNRLAEALLNEAMTNEGKLATDPNNKRLQSLLTNLDDLPFLAIESDGSPFPQLITAKLESFCLRAKRLHDKMLKIKTHHKTRLN